MTGPFIVLEGADGSGKTGHAKRLAEALSATGRDVVLTRTPTDEGAGACVRRMLRGEEPQAPPDELARLYAVDRMALAQRLLFPALLAGKAIVCDRYIPSSVVYQGALGTPHNLTLYLNRYLPRPDLTIVLDVPIEECARRMAKRSAEKPSVYDRDPDLQQRVHAGYANTEWLLPEWRIVHVDGRGTVAETAALVWEAARGVIDGVG